MADLEQSARETKDRVEETAKEAKATAQEAAQQVKETAQETAEQAKEQAQELAGKAQQQAKSALSERKSMAAGELDSIASAFRQTSQELRDNEQGALAHYSRSVADQVDQMATYMQSRTFDEMLADAEDFARQQPELFLGGAFALGLLAARFFKSSSARRRTGARTYRGGKSIAGEYGDEYELAPRPRPLPERDVSDEARLYPRAADETDWE